MPNGNGQGPAGAGPKSGRGRGLCSGSGRPGTVNQEVQVEQPIIQDTAPTGCRGPRGCGTGKKSGGGNRRGQR